MKLIDKYSMINVVLQKAKSIKAWRGRYDLIDKIENAADLKQLPLLYKEDLLSAFPELMDMNLKTGQQGIVIATGGSTGQPVTVFAPHHFFLKEITEKWRPLTTKDIFCNLLSPGRLWVGYTFFNVLGSMLAGVTIPLGGLSKDEMDTWVPFLTDKKVSALGVNPSSLQILMQYLKEKNIHFPSLRKIIWGGEPFTPELYALKQEVLPQAELWGLYGSAEVFSIGSNTPADPLNVFDLHEFQHIEIEEGRILSTNFHPEYPSIALRYAVGDSGELDEARQRLRLLGRADDEVKFNVNTFSPTRFVELVKSLPVIENAQIAISKSSAGKDFLEIHVLPKQNQMIKIEELKDFILKHSFMINSFIGNPDDVMRIYIVTEMWRNPRTHKIPAVAPAKNTIT